MSKTLKPEDVALLDLTMGLRERMVRKITKLEEEKLPAKASEILAVTGLLDSVDKTVLAKAKLRLEEESAEANEAHSNILRALMIQMHSNVPQNAPVGTARELPMYASQALEIKTGELIQGSSCAAPNEP